MIHRALALKILLGTLASSATLFAQACPVEPPDLAPVGMVNAKHVCVCDSLHCAWAWIPAEQATARPASNTDGIALMQLLANNSVANANAQANAEYNGPLSRRCAAAAALFGGNMAQCMAIQEAKERAHQQKLEAQRQQFLVSVELARHAHADFDAVVNNAHAVVPPAMAAALIASRTGGEIVYYLAEHQQDHWRIAALPDNQQKHEIGKIEKLVQRDH
jgi:hypothetical protein